MGQICVPWRECTEATSCFVFKLKADASPKTQEKVLHFFPLPSPILLNFKMYVVISGNQHERGYSVQDKALNKYTPSSA